MSLIVTANKVNEQTKNLDWHKPYSYHNSLSNNFRIPKNSQVAVVSVKFNLDGMIEVSQGKNKFFTWFGEELSQALNKDATVSQIVEVNLDNGVYGLDEYVEKLRDSLQKTVAFPDCEVLVTKKVNVVTNAFEGFNITYVRPEKSGSRISSNWYNPAWGNYSGDGNFVWDNTAKSLTCSIDSDFADSEYCYATGTDFPISQVDGEMIIDLSGLGVTDAWCVGLSRSQSDCIALANGEPFPSYYSESSGPIVSNELEGFWDSCISFDTNVGSFLRVLCPRAVEAGLILMTEVDYSTQAAPFDVKYDWVTNTEAFTHAKWEMDGENVKISLGTHSSGPWTSMVDRDSYGDTKPEMLKYIPPLNQAQWWQYPLFYMSKIDQVVVIDEFNGVDTTKSMYKDYKYDSNVYCWYEQMECLGEPKKPENNAHQVELRPWNQTDPNLAQVKTYVQTSRPDHATIVDYKPQLILEEDALYKDSKGANSKAILGFDDSPPDSTTTDRNVAFSSTSIPDLKTYDSLYVRLNNFPIVSQNAAKGFQSNIIYGVPRFDNSGEDTGGLYFTAPERLYVNLNNAADMYINQIDLDVIKSDETLATALTGRTEIVLHIKETSCKC